MELVLGLRLGVPRLRSPAQPGRYGPKFLTLAFVWNPTSADFYLTYHLDVDDGYCKIDEVPQHI
jgi:hypothetical protein